MGQTSLSLGGPIGINRTTHFMVAAEYTREKKLPP